MTADDSHFSIHTKEVTMLKRFFIVAIVVAAILVVAAPAFAFDGFRQTYTNSAVCAICHSGTSGPLGVYSGWATTKHAELGVDDTGAPVAANAEPIRMRPALRRLPFKQLQPSEGVAHPDGAPVGDRDHVRVRAREHGRRRRLL